MLTKLFLSPAGLRGGSGRPQSSVLFYLQTVWGVPRSDLSCPGGGGLRRWGLWGAGTCHGDWISLAWKKRAEPQEEEEEALPKLEEKSLLVVPLYTCTETFDPLWALSFPSWLDWCFLRIHVEIQYMFFSEDYNLTHYNQFMYYAVICSCG